jgi:CubicO group peptidase (beta-lactamase class C family)
MVLILLIRTIKVMQKYLLLLLLFGCIAAASAQTPDLTSLGGTESGARVVAYFAAFNSGDEQKLKTFFLENVDPEALKQRPVEPRLAFHRQVREDFKTVDVKKIVSANAEQITVLAQSVNGSWISYSFRFDPLSKKISGFAIEPTEPPGDTSSIALKYPDPSTRAELLSTTERYFADLAKDDEFSGVVMIAKDNAPIYIKAFGYSDKEKKVLNNTDTRFNLGSINKNFTRVAIGQLIRQGKLSWDDKLIKILPDYPNKEAASKITVGQLVTMRSGIGDFFNDRYNAADKKKLLSNKDYLPLFGSDPLEFEPGTKTRYSNGGYVVLGLVIEKISGMSYYDYVRQNIFIPAGMSFSDSFALGQLPANTATGYIGRGAGRTTNQAALPGRGSSAGGGYSNAADLLKYSVALRSMKVEVPDDDGKFPAKFGGIGIAGGTEGVNALFITNGQTGYTIVVLSNYDPPSAEKPGTQVRNWLKGIKE